MSDFLFSRVKKWLPAIYGLAGAFIIVAGWNWYHLPHRPRFKFILISFAAWIVVYLLFITGKKLFLYAVKKTERHPFWSNEFASSVNKLFFTSSLLFLMFFSRRELVSMIYSSIILAALFVVVGRQLSRHPGAAEWKIVNRGVFSIVFFLFLLNSILQYFGFRFYILDAQSKIYNIAVFRAWSMTMLWLTGFAIGALVYIRGKRWWHCLGVLIWALAQLFTLFIWIVNAGVLYFAGLYFSPVVLQHAGESAGGVIWNWLAYILIIAYLISSVALIFIVKYILRAHRAASQKYWKFYYYLVALVGFLTMFAFGSLQTTPEFIIAKSFYGYFFGKEEKIKLPDYIFAKLERFGLKYNLNEFYVAHKEGLSNKPAPLISEKFKDKKPNIILVYLESFSSRFVDVYNNNRFKNLTPGLDALAADPNTTIFKNFYNASTPSITGVLSQYCSFLPPTGHEELERERKIKKVYLLCLPEILKRNGYKYAGYVTAVQREFANKGSLIESLGTDELYGTKELSKIIEGEPLAWGYSDHQMFPAMMEILEKKPKPFFMAIATVDTHPPFNTVKDKVQFKNSRSNVLNAFHTTDDAFRIFWEEFKKSEYYDNTIIIAVADHAIFPNAITKDIFPEDAGNAIFYDENTLMMYIPDSKLPKKIDVHSSGIDITPTILDMLGIDSPNSFEGHSIFGKRKEYPGILGMHEFGLYINQVDSQGKRVISYNIPNAVKCGENDYNPDSNSPLTMCEYLDFYKWKRQMFEEGRFWEK